MFFQLFLNVTWRKYLDAHQSVKVVRVNVCPVLGLDLNCVSMPSPDNLRFHDIQVKRGPHINVTGIRCFIEANPVNHRFISLVRERCSAYYTQLLRQLGCKGGKGFIEQ